VLFFVPVKLRGANWDVTGTEQSSRARMKRLTSSVVALVMSSGVATPADAQSAIAALAGSWTLAAADLLHPDGTRTRDYGAAPKGLLIIDASGHYSLQIFKTERPRFASADKAKGTPAEFESAVLGSSTHYGTMSLDSVAHVLTVNIEGASFPNQEGTQQTRHYTLTGDELSYRVAPRPDGNIPISVWHRVRTDASLPEPAPR